MIDETAQQPREISIQRFDLGADMAKGLAQARFYDNDKCELWWRNADGSICIERFERVNDR